MAHRGSFLSQGCTSLLFLQPSTSGTVLRPRAAFSAYSPIPLTRPLKTFLFPPPSHEKVLSCPFFLALSISSFTPPSLWVFHLHLPAVHSRKARLCSFSPTQLVFRFFTPVLHPRSERFVPFYTPLNAGPSLFFPRPRMLVIRGLHLSMKSAPFRAVLFPKNH